VEMLGFQASVTLPVANAENGIIATQTPIPKRKRSARLNQTGTVN
jgi:hypothetical protein